MHNHLPLFLFSLLSGSLLASPGVREADIYHSEIRPILATHCFGCHGPGKQKGGLRLDTLDPGFEGPAAETWHDVLENLNLGEMLVMTKGGEARERAKEKLEKLFDGKFPNVRGRVNRLENGPPVGYPVQFRVYGQDNAKIRAIGQQVADIMREEPHVRQVNQDWGERIKRVQVDVDQDKARALGISSGQIKAALEASLSGTPITQYREEDQGIDVVSRLVAAERTDLNNLKDAKIYVRDGKFVPVSQVARLTLDSEDSELWRRNRVPTLTVRADLDAIAER